MHVKPHVCCDYLTMNKDSYYYYYWNTFQKWCKVTEEVRYYFPENFRSNLKFYESKNLSDSSLHCIFESENFTFPLATKNSFSWGVKCETHSVQFSIKMTFYQVCCLALRQISTWYNNTADLFVIYCWFLSLSDLDCVLSL